MPVVKVWTSLPVEEYQKFKEKAEQMRMKPYELAQYYILIGINESEKSLKKILVYKLQKAIEYLWEDLKKTPEWAKWDLEHTFEA